MKFILLTFTCLTALAQNFEVRLGTYTNDHCFMKIEKKEGHLAVFRFANKNSHLNNPGDDHIFNPDTVLGSTVIYDLHEQKVQFGPSYCQEGIVQSSWERVRRRSFTLGCGGPFRDINVKLKMRTNRDKEVISFDYKEKFNRNPNGGLHIPGNQVTNHYFSCDGLSKIEN